MRNVVYGRWSPPQSPLRIEFPRSLLEEIRQRASGRDACGLLYGYTYANEVRVVAVRQPEDNSGVSIEDASVVGVYAVRARGEVFMTETDLETFERHESAIALVLAGGKGGFFVREFDGSIQTVRSYEEFAITEAAPKPARPDRSTPQLVSNRRRINRRWPVAVTVILIALAGPPLLRNFLAPAPSLSLAVREQEGQLVITWNPRAVLRGGQLELFDGTERRIYPLLPQQSSATYVLQSREVDVRLTPNPPNGGVRAQAARLVSTTREP
jgi:hypothetical protein